MACVNNDNTHAIWKTEILQTLKVVVSTGLFNTYYQLYVGTPLIVHIYG
jgi:hypothetical protein